LELDGELKLLKLLTRAKREFNKIGISTTYLGAHAVPKLVLQIRFAKKSSDKRIAFLFLFLRGKSVIEATKDILDIHLPTIKEMINSKDLEIDNIDVFCEKGLYNVEQTESILRKGKSLCNLNSNFHADELNPLNSVEVILIICEYLVILNFDLS
jgi:imidazolonepropionase